MDKLKGKAQNDFNLAASQKKRDNSENPGLDGPKPPGGQPRRSEEGRLKKGNEIHMKAMNPKGPSPGR